MIGGKAQLVAYLTGYRSGVILNPASTGFPCFLEQEILPLLLSTYWFQDRI